MPNMPNVSEKNLLLKVEKLAPEHRIAGLFFSGFFSNVEGKKVLLVKLTLSRRAFCSIKYKKRSHVFHQKYIYAYN